MSDALHSYLLDPLERASSTFVQQFTVLLLATGSAGLIEYQAWGRAADVAGFAAIISVITSVLTFPVPKLDAGLDLLVRVAKTGVQSFLGVLAGDQFSHSVVHADWKAALAVAVPVMLTAALKGLAALAAPWSDGASLLPVGPLTYDEPALDDDVDAPGSVALDNDPAYNQPALPAEGADPPAAAATVPDSIKAADPAVNGVASPEK